uniref:LRRCT domain-containing protein n=1 Tax=Panagrellus redivivus TaxID=6233 RepID=A0A7E4W7C1_PANRE
MNHLKLGLLLLSLFCLAVLTASAPTSAEIEHKSSRSRIRGAVISLKAKKKSKKHPAKKDDDDEEEDEEEDSNEDDGDDDDGDDDDRILAACDDDGICSCSVDTLNCDKQTDPDGKNQDLINTLNVEVKNRKFKVVTANFRGNQISEITGKILPGQEDNVEVLDLTDNLISSIDDAAFEGLEKLHKLKLNHNLIKDVNNKVFSRNLDNLHELRLANNLITRIKPGAFKFLQNLKKLVLDGNKGIEFTAKSFDGLDNLEELSLDYCDINQLDDDVFKHLNKLKKLSLIGNPLVSIPKAINAIPQLNALDLSNTSLPELNAKSISSDHELQELYINNMHYLYAIHEESLSGLPKLVKLDASNSTHLYEIHPNAFGDKTEGAEKDVALRELYLSYCNFSKLPSDLLDWTKVESLEINGNPLACDCTMDWLINDQSLHLFKNSPICAKPEELKGQTFAQVINKVCDSTIIGSSNRVVTSFLMLMIIMALIVGFLVYTRRLKMTNLAYQPEMPQMGYSNLSAQQHREDELQLQDDFEHSPPQVV